MAIQSFMIVEKNSGVPLYSNNFELQDEDAETDQVLFSGLMTAIQSLMEELTFGNLNQIQTEKYQIIGYETDKYNYFVVGEFDSTEIIYALLTEIAEYFEKLRKDDELPGLTEEEEYLITEKIKFIKSLSEKSNYHISIFNYSTNAGLEEITQEKNYIVDCFLACYFSKLANTYLKKNHSFYNILANGATLLGLTYLDTRDEFNNVIIICLYFSSTSFSSIISYKHKFTNLGLELLGNKIDQLTNKSVNNSEKEEIIKEFSDDLKGSMVDYIPTEEMLGVETLLEIFQDKISDVISTIMLGKPIAILADEISAKYIMDFIVYISGLSDASVDISSDIPRRFIWCPPDKVDFFTKLGYAFLDLENVELKNGLKSEYFDQIYLDLKDDETYTQVQKLKSACERILLRTEVVIFQIGKGARINDVLDLLDELERSVVEDILNWVNPLIMKDQIRVISEKKINW
jgi:uncharacterized protein YejL (UPF0352 family)